MAKELNLFEMDLAETAVNEPESYVQPGLPGVLERVQQSQIQQQKERHFRLRIKRIIEAILFSSSEPVSFQKLREITDAEYPIKPRILKELITELQNEYLAQQRSFRLEEIAEGFILRTSEEYGPYIELLHRNKRTEKLSPAAAEVLAIIAYKQPITKPQIEAIRGVDSSGVVAVLLERQLIEPVGKMESPGRPTLYSITKDFLQHFGLKDLKELPPLA